MIMVKITNYSCYHFTIIIVIVIYNFISPSNGSTKLKKTFETTNKQSSTLEQHENI